MSVSEDLRFPGVPGRRPLSTRALNAWVDRVVRAASTDAEVADAFLRTVNLMRRPESLLSPALAVRVLRSRRTARTMTDSSAAPA